MNEHITPGRIEDAIDATNSFISQQRGAPLDGGFAGQQLHERIRSTAERAQQLLTETAHPNHSGLYVPLHSKNEHRFSEAMNVLPGHIVLLPSRTIDKQGSAFYPAVVSEDSLAHNALRLHVIRQPYQQKLLGSTRTLLSGAAQAETAGIGNHGRTPTDGVEAEHFTTLLTISGNERMRSQWASGNHINHTWRQHEQTSVTSEMHRQLFSDEIPQTTITISQQDIASGTTALFWHDSLRDDNGYPEHAGKQDALIIVQALGFQALKDKRPKAINAVKEMLK